MNTAVGLSSEEVAKSRELHGLNVLEPPPHRSAWSILLGKFKDPLIIILAFSTLLSCLTGGWVDGAGILLAIVLSVGIGFFSEYRAGREFDILNKTEDETPVKVRRDGKLIACPKSQLVVGDVIVVETGEEIPADARVLESSEFQVDQSKFTGEPEAVMKVPATDQAFTPLAQTATYAPDMVLRGSNVISGTATLQITAVGMATEIGQTARAATEITDATTPLQKQLTHLSKVIAVFGISISCLLFLILLSIAWQQDTLSWPRLLGFFMLAVTLIVVTVPEGLPMSVTLSLACSMRKMAKSNCLIRKLHACETIGCATTICTDKTGTLTMNQMRVAKAVFPAGSEDLVRGSLAVNSTAELNGEEVLGNPTEGALLLFLKSQGVEYLPLRQSVTVERRWNFTTETKYMATRLTTGMLLLKGAPEIVLAKCSFFRDGGNVVALSEGKRKELLDSFREEQDKGCRTLAFAYSESRNDPATAKDLTYLGFTAISDPVRPEVPAAIAACRQAGIEVKIVTGDTGATAAEIASQIGLDPEEIMEGREFGELDEVARAKSVENLSVVARARPNDKLVLVQTLQGLGRVVAVTGDGTNDSPALHHADVGIAMGKTGTAIAREASDIILLDDSFQSIVNAVLWGRSLYWNIQRFLVFQLTINLAAAMIAVSGPFFGIEMPFTVIQMLWINLIMDTFAALALATEPPDPAVMLQPPRKPGTFIITRLMAEAIIGVAVIFTVFFFVVISCWETNGLSDRELTIIFTAFVFLQIWNLCNVRALGNHRSMVTHPPNNPVFTWIFLGIIVVQILITQFGGKIFRTVPLSFADWVSIICMTSGIFWLGEIYRWFKRRMK